MIKVLSREAVFPVNVERVRHFLRLDTSVDDGLLQNLIEAATQEVEVYTGLLLSPCVCELSMDIDTQQPQGIAQLAQRELSIPLPHAPFIKMISVKVGERVVSHYRLKVSPQDVAVCEISLTAGKALHLKYEAGFQQAPEALKLAVLEIVAFRYEHRGQGETQVPGIESFLRPYRLLHL